MLSDYLSSQKPLYQFKCGGESHNQVSSNALKDMAKSFYNF